MAKILVCMGAREYYGGDTTVDLPWTIDEEDIRDVEPQGYGQFVIWLNEHGKAKAEVAKDILGKEFEDKATYGWWRKCSMTDEWNLLMESDGTFGLQLTYEVNMEFSEVDENMVDHWEVKGNEDGCTEAGNAECRGSCPRCCEGTSS